MFEQKLGRGASGASNISLIHMHINAPAASSSSSSGGGGGGSSSLSSVAESSGSRDLFDEDLLDDFDDAADALSDDLPSFLLALLDGDASAPAAFLLPFGATNGF